jgi:predicted Zn-dependent protease
MATTTMPAGIRLTRRGRAVLIGTAATLLLVAFWLTANPGAHAGSGTVERPAKTQTVTVEPGDTLWSIASRARPSADPRVTVQRIIDLNGLAGSVVQPGQRIALP